MSSCEKKVGFEVAFRKKWLHSVFFRLVCTALKGLAHSDLAKNYFFAWIVIVLGAIIM